MSNSEGGFVALLWIGTLLLSIGSGVLAWNLVDPESFLGAIGFLLVWGILSKIAHFIMFGIVISVLDN